MKKEILEKLLKETSPQDLWNQLKKIEEAIGGSLDEVENLEDILVAMLLEEAEEPEDKSLTDESMGVVAKAKGLPAPIDGTITKFFGLDFKPASHLVVEAKITKDTELKGAKVKREAKDYYPTPEELVKINAVTNVDVSKEDVLVFNLHSADQEVDRSSDQFTSKGLKDMADRSVGKPYLRDHNWSTGSVIGKIFDASVSNKRLMQKVFVPISDTNKDVIQGHLLGTLDKVSVGFAMDAKDYVCSSCSKSLYSMECPHYPGAKDKEGNPVVGLIKGVKDYFEISNVVVPCQPAAGIRRADQKSVAQEDTEVKTSGDSEKRGMIIEITEGDLTLNPTLEVKYVDKISNDKLHGDNPVSVEENNKEAEVVTPEVTKEAPAPEAVQAPETKSVEESKEVVLVKELVSTLSSELIAPLKALIEDLKSTIEAKKEVEKSVEDESTEEIARKLAATQVEAPASQASSAPVNKGWSGNLYDILTKPAQQ